MSEIFDIIIAVNNLTDHVKHLSARIDNLCKNPSLIANDKYVNEQTASKLLHVGVRELQRMRKNGEIIFIRHHRKILYPADAINNYLNDNQVLVKKSA